MALGTYNMDITFTEGQDTRTDSKNVTVSKPLTLKNVRFEQTGAITTRPGYQELTTQDCEGVVAVDNTALLFNDGTIYHMAGNAGAAAIGIGYNAYARKQLIGSSSLTGSVRAQTVDIGAFNNTIVTAWSEADTTVTGLATPATHLRIQIEQVADRFGNGQVTGSFVLANNIFAQEINVNVVSATYAVVWAVDNSNNLLGRLVNLVTNTSQSLSLGTVPIGAPKLLRTTYIETIAGVATFGLIYYLNDTSILLRHAAVTLATGAIVLSSATTVATITSVTGRNLALAVSDVSGTKRLNCMWGQAAAIGASAYSANSGLTLQWGPTSISGSVGADWVGLVQTSSASHALTTWSWRENPWPSIEHRLGALSASGLYTLSTTYPYSSCPIGRLYLQDNRPFVAYHTAKLPSVQIGEIGILAYDATYGATKITSWESCAITSTSGSLFPYATNEWVAANTASVEALSFSPAPTGGAGTINYVTQARYRYSPSWAYISLTKGTPQAVRINAHTLVGAGTWLTYDGARAKPSYFVNPMAYMTNAAGAAGSSLNGAYQYCATIEWLDARGNRHTSAPSTPVIFYADGSAFGVFYFYTQLLYSLNPGWARKGAMDEPKIGWYATEANGSIFYSATLDVLGYNYYDYTTWSGLSLPVTLSPGSAISGILYTAGGVLENDSLPSPRFLTEYKGRAITLTAGWDNRVFFSKPAEPGIAVEWSLALYFDVPARGGLTLGLQQMDSALYLFKSNQILTTYGDPPGATGEGGSFSIPQVVFDGVGVKDPESIILTPKGIMFKSDKGFYMILRNQELAYIGEGPFNQTAQVYSATCDLQRQEVLFTLADGVILVYNYYQNAWSYYDVPWTPVPGGGMYRGNRHLLGATTAAYYLPISDDSPGYQDGSVTNIETVVETGWVRMNGIAGYQRVKRAYCVGDWSDASADPADLTVDVAIDYGSSAGQTATVDVGDMPVRSEFEIHLSKQKCESMKFKFTQNQGRFEISGMTLDLGVKSGTNKSRAGAGSY
jgi:hypothetical protein